MHAVEHDALKDRVEFHHHPAYEPWCRDHGPVFIVNDSERRGQLGIQCVGRKISAVRSGQRHSGAHYRPRPALFHAGHDPRRHDRGQRSGHAHHHREFIKPQPKPRADRAAIEQQLRDFPVYETFCGSAVGLLTRHRWHVVYPTRFVDTQTVVTAVEPDPQITCCRRTRQAMRTEYGSPLRVIERPA